MRDIKETVCDNVGEAAHWIELSDKIHANPETNFQEYKAVAWLSEELKALGFEVLVGVAGLDTAFVATKDGDSPGPAVGLILEYDALEGMGHACGHNTKGPMALAGIEAFLKACESYRGKIVVFGCPAEEGGGGKIIMADADVFSAADLCLEPTVGPDFATGQRRQAVQSLCVTFTGKTGHPALKGAIWTDALDALLFVWNGLQYLKRILGERGVIHGVIVEGGVVPAAVPDKAVAKLHVRAGDLETVKEYVGYIEDLASIASRASGAGLSVEKGLTYLDYIKCPSLTEMIVNNFHELGVEPRVWLHGEPRGASDTANVSHVVPCETLTVSIGKDLLPHTDEYRIASGGEAGRKAIRAGAKMVAMCLVDLLVGDSDALLASVKNEFDANRKK